MDENIPACTVTDSWVKTNFHEKYLNKVKHQKNNTFCQIMPGNKLDDHQNNLIKKDPNAPKIKYIQGEKEYCMAYSWASALYYYTTSTGIADNFALLTNK